MSEDKVLDAPKSVTSIWPAVVPLVVAVIIFAVAQNYSEIAKRFPTMVAISLGVLSIFDIYSRTNLPGQALVSAFWGSGFERREMAHNPKLRSEFSLLAWLVFAFGAMAVVGILVAVPLFVTLYVWLRSKRPIGQALITGLVLFGFEFVVFEWLLNYDLYRGLILTGEGFSAW